MKTPGLTLLDVLKMKLELADALHSKTSHIPYVRWKMAGKIILLVGFDREQRTPHDQGRQHGVPLQGLRQRLGPLVADLTACTAVVDEHDRR